VADRTRWTRAPTRAGRGPSAAGRPEPVMDSWKRASSRRARCSVVP